MFGPNVEALWLVTATRHAHAAASFVTRRVHMESTKQPASPRPPEMVDAVWFETRWGIAMCVLAVCLAGSALLLYLAIYLAWL